MKTYFLFFATMLWATAQAPDEEARARQSAEALTKIQWNWGASLNSPGAALRVTEASRQRTDGFTEVRYRMYGEGLPKDETYSLFQTSLPQARPKALLSGIRLFEKGLAICAGRPDTCGTPEKPNDPIELTLRAAAGEVKLFSLVSADGKAKAFFSIEPFPIQGADHGCTLEIQRVLSKAEIIVLQGKGFTPDAEVNLDSSSEGEEHSEPGKTDAQGNYRAALLPYVKGKQSGRLFATLHSASCNPSASIEWGKGSDHLE